ncbi:N(6)-adenine-specific methyltransferase METTL4-like [Haliotis asinina]|uniref:N(6)-adenine-specific methyltransferase METTL4-like n=1 Tax=Haliotis asinina TaxID=109174 RepID=UPI0035325EB2
MTVVCKTEAGWVIDHQRAVDEAYGPPHPNTHYSLKSALFDLQCPFIMDSQFEKWRHLKEAPQAPQTKKRKRKKHTMSCDDEAGESKELVVRLSSAHTTLVNAARQHGHLLVTRSVPSDNNITARQAASLAGSGDRLAEVAEAWSKGENSWQSPYVITGDEAALSMTDVFHRRVTYKGDDPVFQCLDDHHYLIPPRSSFVMSNYDQLLQNCDTLQVSGGYDLIVVDPPWQNKSVKRKRSYYSLEEESFLQLPVSDLASPNCLIVVWVTNKPRLTTFVQDQLLPHWGIKRIVQWHWMKVTVDGTMICDIDSPTKKPYETLLLGQLVQKGKEITPKNQAGPPDTSAKGANSPDVTHDNVSGGNVSNLPDSRVIVSVPCSLHSKKPPLLDVLAQYLPPKPACLELFARNLWPHWVSWGHEVLKHQHVDYYEEKT